MDLSTGALRDSLADLVRRKIRDAELIQVIPFGPDATNTEATGPTTKSVGYGVPLKLVARTPDGQTHQLVFHTATANVFGHDWRADRAAEMLLGFDTFAGIPNHVLPLDVGAIARDAKSLVSLGETDEFYLLTSYGEGSLYAQDLRRIGRTQNTTADDTKRCQNLARWLAELHAEPLAEPHLYTRSVRDVVGSGEGIFGIIDGYPDDAAGVTSQRLQSIEQLCVAWRWRLRARTSRLRRIHGDFHPFNILFDDNSQLTLLDASRGSVGDPADDVACLAINYLFFAIGTELAWTKALRSLWYEFWSCYLDKTGDEQIKEVIAPYFAWRGLVLANPAWYPELASHDRDALLCFVETTLQAPRFDPEFAEAVFR